jgi:hypothetical protein
VFIVIKKGHESLDTWDSESQDTTAAKTVAPAVKTTTTETTTPIIEAAAAEEAALVIEAAAAEEAAASETAAIVDWDYYRVLQWFEENTVHEAVRENLRPCDGEVLKEVFMMKQRAPEFFYSRFDRVVEGDLRALAEFSAQLSELFEHHRHSSSPI